MNFKFLSPLEEKCQGIQINAINSKQQELTYPSLWSYTTKYKNSMQTEFHIQGRGTEISFSKATSKSLESNIYSFWRFGVAVDDRVSC